MSQLNRRQFQTLGAAALGSLGVPAIASAADKYPSRAVRVVVPFAPGGGTDTLGRAICQKLTEQLGQPFVVDNKPGASGIIGTDAVAKAAPDGYTLNFNISTALLINQFLYNKLPYNPLKDLSMVYKAADGYTILAVHPSLPVKNGKELMDYIKANRGKLTYGSYGQGSFPHLAGAYLDHITQGGMQHAAYKGEAPCVQDLLSGQIHMTWASAFNLKQHAELGKLRLIGVQGNKRLPALPDLPTLPESGLKGDPFELVGFLAMAAPAKTPKAIQELIAAEIRKAFTDPAMKARIDGMGYGMVPDSGPEQFLADYRRDTPKWEALVKQSGVKLDI